jgi:hypothetical protein
MPSGPNTKKTGNQGLEGPTQPIASTHPTLTWHRRNLRDAATCTTHRRASANFEVNWEILARLSFIWSKPLDLDACPALTSLHQFCGTTDKPKVAWFCGPNQETIVMILRSKSLNRSCRFWCPNHEILHHLFWGQTGRNRHHRFCGQSGRNHPSGFEVKPLTKRPSGFEVKPLTNRQPWFWGTTKKLTLLVSSCTVQTAHSVTWPLDRPACATIPGSLHQVFYSCHDPRRCMPCRTYHLHTKR